MDLIIGDELVPDYSAKHLNPRFESKSLTKALGTKVEANAVKGAGLTIPGKGNILHQLRQFSLPAYKRIFLSFGANDYLNSKAPIDQVAKGLNDALAYIRKQYQYILVYGILPIPMYDKKGHSYSGQRGQAAYTLQDLCDMLSLVYKNNRISCLNWFTLSAPVVSLTNYKDRLKDGRYPTKQTYQLMSDRIASFVKRHPKGL